VPAQFSVWHNRGKRLVVKKLHLSNISVLFTVPQVFGTVMATKVVKP
jgi:hypothetical protein